MGCVPPEPGFLASDHRALPRARRALDLRRGDDRLPRSRRGGAQERYGLAPDLTCLGKIVGGGMPLAAYGGRADDHERASRRSARSTRRAR